MVAFLELSLHEKCTQGMSCTDALGAHYCCKILFPICKLSQFRYMFRASACAVRPWAEFAIKLILYVHSRSTSYPMCVVSKIFTSSCMLRTNMLSMRCERYRDTFVWEIRGLYVFYCMSCSRHSCVVTCCPTQDLGTSWSLSAIKLVFYLRCAWKFSCLLKFKLILDCLLSMWGLPQEAKHATFLSCSHFWRDWENMILSHYTKLQSLRYGSTHLLLVALYHTAGRINCHLGIQS